MFSNLGPIASHWHKEARRSSKVGDLPKLCTGWPICILLLCPYSPSSLVEPSISPCSLSSKPCPLLSQRCHQAPGLRWRRDSSSQEMMSPLGLHALSPEFNSVQVQIHLVSIMCLFKIFWKEPFLGAVIFSQSGSGSSVFLYTLEKCTGPWPNIGTHHSRLFCPRGEGGDLLPVE